VDRGPRRYFSTTTPLRIVDLNPDLVNSCTEFFQSSSQIFSTILSKYSVLENIAFENGFEDILELKYSILDGKSHLSNGKELFSEIDKLDSLFADGQGDMHSGNKIFKELRSSSAYNKLSFDQKSKVLSALVDSKSMFMKAEIRLLMDPFFTAK
jgi:hypothetical protein